MPNFKIEKGKDSVKFYSSPGEYAHILRPVSSNIRLVFPGIPANIATPGKKKKPDARFSEAENLSHSREANGDRRRHPPSPVKAAHRFFETEVRLSFGECPARPRPEPSSGRP